jgi:hypothetical protein
MLRCKFLPSQAKGAGLAVMVVPLRKVDADGKLYERRPEIEAALGKLVLLPLSEVADCCEVTDTASASHLPSECLLHLVRASRLDNSDTYFEALYRALLQRVLAQLPRTEVGRDAEGKILVSQKNVQIVEGVMDRFLELLMLDRGGYDDRLDYFEVNFDDAVVALRSTARKKAWKEEKRSEPMTYDEETSELNAEIETAAAGQNPLSASKLDEPGYRLRLDAAIDALPERQRRVIELLRKEVLIDSKEPGVQTIVRILKCAEKTVRNRRDKAFEALRKALGEEES